MTYTLTQQLSHAELWESWDPTRTEDENGCRLLAFTPMGQASLRTMGEKRTWIIEVGWSLQKFSASSEENAIYIAVESYRRTEKNIVEEYVRGLQVKLGDVDESGCVATPTSACSIRRCGDGPLYVLLGGGRVFDSSEDFRVWERVVSEDLCYHLLHTMNLTDEEI